MKELVNILYGEEIKEFKAYTRKQKAVHIYVVVSLFLVFLFACSNSLLAVFLAAANLANAVRLGYKHIPNFGKEEE